MTELTMAHLETIARRNYYGGNVMRIGKTAICGVPIVYASDGHGLLLIREACEPGLNFRRRHTYDSIPSAGEFADYWKAGRFCCDVTVSELREWAGAWEKVACSVYGCVDGRVLKPLECEECEGDGFIVCEECNARRKCLGCDGSGDSTDRVLDYCHDCDGELVWPSARVGTINGTIAIDRALVARYIAAFPDDGVVGVRVHADMLSEVVFDCGAQMAVIMPMRLDADEISGAPSLSG